MKSKIKVLLSSIITVFLILISLIIPRFILADGMVIIPDPFSDRWDYLGENSQQAFINYENGLEKLILSIDMDETSQNAVWIFPVPANPNEVVIDVITKLPQLAGEEVTKKAKSNLLDIKKILSATQIYTIPFINWGGVNIYETRGFGAPGAFETGSREKETDVIIHEHLEKEGITTEIITTKTAQALYQYLQNKGLNIEVGSIPVLSEYIGKNYTFVVSWLSGQETFDDIIDNLETEEPILILPPIKQPLTQRGVFVTFPTEKIYYPLLPTSVYGSKVIPTTIRILGFVDPTLFENIKNYTEISYYLDQQIYLEPEIKNFYQGETKNIKYTKIKINAPSKMLTSDLLTSPQTPLKIVPSLFISQHKAISGIILFILSSTISSALIGLIVFKKARRSPKEMLKFAKIGFFNCFSIIGFIIALSFTKTKSIKPEDQELFNELKRRGYSSSALQKKDARKILFIPLFSAAFLIITRALIELLISIIS